MMLEMLDENRGHGCKDMARPRQMQPLPAKVLGAAVPVSSTLSAVLRNVMSGQQLLRITGCRHGTCELDSAESQITLMLCVPA